MNKTKNIFREYLEALIIAVLVALFLRAFVVQAFRIPTGSMKDTLLIGDFLLVNKFIYGVNTPEHIGAASLKIPSIRIPSRKRPQRGDVIIFRYPRDPGIDYIKRCIGLPGDTIQVINNKVYINGQPEGEEHLVDRKYDRDEEATFNYYEITHAQGKSYTIRKYADGRDDSHCYGPVVVPAHHYFMMGDNRDNSSDSRYWGFVPEENIIGKAVLIYFSYDRRARSGLNLFAAVRWSRLFNVIR